MSGDRPHVENAPAVHRDKHPEPIEGCGFVQAAPFDDAPRQAQGAPQGAYVLDMWTITDSCERLQKGIHLAKTAGEHTS